MSRLFHCSAGLIAAAGVALCAGEAPTQVPFASLHLNGSAQLTAPSTITLTNNLYQAGSAFIPTPYNIRRDSGFSAFFVYTVQAPASGDTADGLAFVAENLGFDSANYLGLSGSGLGFFTLTSLPAVAVTLDYYANSISGSLPGAIAIATTVGTDLVQSVPELPVLPGPGAFRAVWVVYNNTTRKMDVYYGYTIIRPARPTLSTVLPTDLWTLLGGQIYFGVTAATGSNYSVQQLRYFAVNVVP